MAGFYGSVYSTQTTTTLSGSGAVIAFNLDTFKAYTGATWVADGSYITVTANGTRYDIAGYLVDGTSQYFAQLVTWANMPNYGFTMAQNPPFGTVDRVDISITTGNFTEKVVKMYGPIYYITNIAGQTDQVNYTTFNTMYRQTYTGVEKEPVGLDVESGTVSVTFADGTTESLFSSSDYLTWGFTNPVQDGAITATSQTKKISKLYGSVNSVAKPIFMI